MTTFVEPPAEPTDTLTDPRELLVGYLDFYRTAALRKLDGMPEDRLRAGTLPSGWTPLELLKHLAYVERRWLRWGFAAEPVDAPWGDNEDDDPDGRWYVASEESVEDVRTFFLAQCEHSRRIVADAALSDMAGVGGRFDGAKPPPSLAWILFHVLQEYARHVGHFDVVRELADGVVGE